MKKVIAVIAGFCFLCTIARSQESSDIKGTWLNPKKDVKVEIYQAGEKFYGRIVWGKDLYEADGKTLKKDTKNPNTQLRNRDMLNMVILSGFIYQEGEWTGGEIYSPKTGKTFKGKMKLTSGNLEIRGYSGSPMFGKTAVWTRTS